MAFKKVVKGSFSYAYENDLIKTNPSIVLKLPKYDIPPNDPAHIFTNEEINIILDRFKNNHCIYYAFLTAYCTGLRVAEVFALTWRDKLEEVDFAFVKKNGEGTDSCKYPFKVIHYELGIPCIFHDFRDTHATKLIESGADIKSVSKRLGHRSIDFTYDIYVRVTEKMEKENISVNQDLKRKMKP